MESKVKQRRVSFSDSRDNGEDKMWSWFQVPFPQDDDNATMDDEQAAAVAAAAFAINSLQEEELTNLKMRRKEDIISTRPSETSTRRSPGGDTRRIESGIIPIRSQSGVASPRPRSPAARNQNQNGKTRAAAWERSKIERIQKRYEKIKFQIVAWENEKKMEVKLNMERNKKVWEQRRAVLMQHYRNKIARIDKAAQKARAQLAERRRKEESEVREKAKKIRATGTVPVKYCFCFNCC